jgi:hypothetical protein
MGFFSNTDIYVEKLVEIQKENSKTLESIKDSLESIGSNIESIGSNMESIDSNMASMNDNLLDVRLALTNLERLETIDNNLFEMTLGMKVVESVAAKLDSNSLLDDLHRVLNSIDNNTYEAVRHLMEAKNNEWPG